MGFEICPCFVQCRNDSVISVGNTHRPADITLFDKPSLVGWACVPRHAPRIRQIIISTSPSESTPVTEAPISSWCSFLGVQFPKLILILSPASGKARRWHLNKQLTSRGTPAFQQPQVKSSCLYQLSRRLRGGLPRRVRLPRIRQVAPTIGIDLDINDIGMKHHERILPSCYLRRGCLDLERYRNPRINIVVRDR